MAKLSSQLKTKYQGKYTPEEVLQVAMDYLHEKSNRHAKAIQERLENQNADAVELRLHFEAARKTREQMIDVASKLAPYIHPKLESIDINSEIEHRFVIVAPKQANSTKEFLSLVGREEKPPILSNTKTFTDNLITKIATLDIDDDEDDAPLID